MRWPPAGKGRCAPGRPIGRPGPAPGPRLPPLFGAGAPNQAAMCGLPGHGQVSLPYGLLPGLYDGHHAAQHNMRGGNMPGAGPAHGPNLPRVLQAWQPLLLFFLSDAFPGKRQGASADKMQLKAATVLSHGSGESHKLDPIDRGHGAQHLYRQLGPSGKHRGHLVPDGLMQCCLRGHLQFAGCFLGVPSIMHQPYLHNPISHTKLL